ncbi:prophage tail fiber N-terminal domain-containing protein [Budviciaceae bacterium CWB-B4]|uniref:Prophage tail fiber N-terminal domain-containing protein n=1 Tax=Limnobaculum xujianqingii TaxID=2738837 RepID=A0A9D7AG04_9GAMM|nr:prophage tail fiber N-terminal domain-containing protein [Limnobaculum xujianqingii]MBK5072019.1 prophage tail fiber N-terminal domain-containing protein [Limnobaculum xujianqingii]MBK5175328.1 prophage tail fiber N-terminal domain-containing protein [Limnobaculum xujianqingii]
MAIKIAGILKDGIGEPIPNCTIELKTKRTTQNVIIKTEASLLIDKNGSYSMDVEPGEYDVTLYVEGFSPKSVGSITIYSDSSSGTLNDFLILPGDSDLSPQQVLVFQQLRDEAKQAAADAKNSAEQAYIALDDKQDKSPLLTAIAALKTAANELIYLTGSDSAAVTALSELGRTLLSVSDASSARSTINAAADNEVLKISNCLSELRDTTLRSTARSNLGLSNLATESGSDLVRVLPSGSFNQSIRRTDAYPSIVLESTRVPTSSVGCKVLLESSGSSLYFVIRNGNSFVDQMVINMASSYKAGTYTLYSSANTIVDENGFIKKA